MRLRKMVAAVGAAALAALSLQMAPLPAQARSASEIVPDAHTVILDHFNGSTTGTAYGGFAYVPSISGLGQAAEFGLDKYVKYSLPGWPGGEGTIELWIKPSAFDSYGNEFLHINWFDAPSPPTFGGNIFGMAVYGFSLLGAPAYAPNVGTLQTVADTPLPLNEWTHLAVSWGAAGTRIYMNGVDRTGYTTPGAPDLNPQNWLYLNSWGVPTGAIDALMDEFHVSNIQRTPDEIAAHAALRYDFSGFSSPVDDPPAVNDVKAGSAVPVKFSLGADEGLDVLAPGSPMSQAVDCTSGAAAGDSVPAVSVRKHVLTYDSYTGLYQFVWKTDKSWAGTCRVFQLELNDGTAHTALFRF